VIIGLAFGRFNGVRGLELQSSGVVVGVIAGANLPQNLSVLQSLFDRLQRQYANLISGLILSAN